MVRDSAWRQWYQAQHQAYFNKEGTAFEEYVSHALELFHSDYYDPDSAGSLGDGGCDGLAENFTICYACYGKSPKALHDTSAERRVTEKIEHDFRRAVSQFDQFTIWRFVTNARVGPQAMNKLAELQREHDLSSSRLIKLIIWDERHFWDQVVSRLSDDDLNILLPGVPHAANVKLEDLAELIEHINISVLPQESPRIGEVSFEKMEFNKIPPARRYEFSEGRQFAPRIDSWFEQNANPDFSDQKAAQFRELYRQAKQTADDPNQIIETLYIAVGGSDFRLDERATAVYAVIAYFFDRCDIFEDPYASAEEEGMGKKAVEDGAAAAEKPAPMLTTR